MKTITKGTKNLLWAIGINVCFMLIMIALCGVNYELADDWFMSENLVNGNSDYIFCNYFIQLFSLMLQKAIYPINAFIVLQIFLNFVSLTMICFCILNTCSFKKGILFSILLECFFAINAYSLITFTKTAAILIVGGGLTILWAYHNKKNVGYSIFGIILVLLGSFYRFKIFYSIFAVFCFGILALILIKLKKPFLKNFFVELKAILSLKTISLMFCLLVTVFSFDYLSRHIIYSNEGMDYYKEYNSARASVLDYDIPLYDSAAEQYQNIGFSKNDFKMLQSWYLDDEGYLDLDTLHDLQQLQSETKESYDTLKYIKNMAFGEILKIVSLDPQGFLMVAYLLVALSMLLIFKRNSILLVGIVTFGIGLLYLYLWLGGRIVYRAVFSIWFAAVVFLLYSTQFLEYRDWISKTKERNSRSFCAAFMSICLTGSLVFLICTTTIQSSKLKLASTENNPQLEEYITSSDKTFALSCSSYHDIRKSTIFSNPLYIGEEPVFDKCLFFGSAYYAHPSYNEFLSQHDIKNLYTDIVDNNNILFVDTVENGHIEIIITYLNEEYGQEQSYGSKLIDTVGKFNIYEIITVN